MSEVLVIDGHPRAGSLCDGLASAYAAAVTGVGVARLNLRELSFDPILHDGYAREQPLEPDLAEAQAAIRAARHLVFVYPTWWGTYPALVKGFVDRVFLPGFAFRFTGPSRWDRLLSGRSARLVVTLDWPVWAYRWVQGAPGRHAMATATLGFCGVKPVRLTELSPVQGSDDVARARFVDRVRRDAQADLRQISTPTRNRPV